MVTLEQANEMKKYVKDTMEPDCWIEVNDKQKEVFKHLMTEWYGWPVFSLNFNKEGNKVQKTMI